MFLVAARGIAELSLSPDNTLPKAVPSQACQLPEMDGCLKPGSGVTSSAISPPRGVSTSIEYLFHGNKKLWIQPICSIVSACLNLSTEGPIT